MDFISLDLSTTFIPVVVPVADSFVKNRDLIPPAGLWRRACVRFLRDLEDARQLDTSSREQKKRASNLQLLNSRCTADLLAYILFGWFVPLVSHGESSGIEVVVQVARSCRRKLASTSRTQASTGEQEIGDTLAVRLRAGLPLRWLTWEVLEEERTGLLTGLWSAISHSKTTRCREVNRYTNRDHLFGRS